MQRMSPKVVAVVAACGLLSEVLACEPAEPVPSPKELLDAAAAIVHVRAFRAVDNPRPRSGPAWSETLIDFQVLSVLKGVLQDPSLSFEGHAVAIDDFNEGQVPYRHVRPSGQMGNCYALEYRLGAEYLLFLGTRELGAEGGLTPYWSPLAPSNEQLTDAKDPWLEWVKENLQYKP
jgi:hypothetical protein